MNPAEDNGRSGDYRRIAKAIDYIDARFESRPTLDQIAAHVNLSRYHFDRLFKRWAGISPMQFLQCLTLNHTKRQLADARSILDASLEAGLSGPGRLHDLFVTYEAMTPGEFKRMGDGLTIRYGIHASPFGDCLIAVTRRGICYLGFVDDDDRGNAFVHLQKAWPAATLVEDPTAVQPIAESIFVRRTGDSSRPFHLHLKGTNFQVNVWRALLAIPMGRMISYADIAAYIGRPKAFRAVAGAIAINPVAFLIPCHRVIARSGAIHRYRWGMARKKAMLGWEASLAERVSPDIHMRAGSGTPPASPLK